MSNDNNPFEDDWRECLEQHFMYAARQDPVAYRTLRPLLVNRLGFTEEQLEYLYVYATMREQE